ncbi:MAG: Gfo/Idh/MocA family oxidoreductase [Planctomycetes bacterium]|nr:Gfo/Idh/MocA family oxidoreductase [Planctomycetota bacterium]MCB9920316.1 Gfo/Idh/MocA family oxidoreductase [Planctomycetota bacterium]
MKQSSKHRHSGDRRASRRHFLASVGSGAIALAGSAKAAPRALANDRVRFGMIGVGSLGTAHLGTLLGMPDVEVVAVADPDARHVERARSRSSRIDGYRDFRDLLNRSDLDAVMVVTPDHWHALASIRAMEAGLDVYCEKPLTLTVAEGREVADTAKRLGAVFQTGTQQRSSKQFRQAAELVRNGKLGKLERVHVSLGQGPMRPRAQLKNEAKPSELDWDLWLGPAPAVPYMVERCHYEFRWFFDYSGGKMTDWGAHHLDIVQWALGATSSGPVQVVAKGVFPENNIFETPVDFDVDYVYPNGVTVHVTGGGENGITFFGTEGRLFVSRSRIDAEPKDILGIDRDDLSIRLEVSPGHHRNFLDCIRSRRAPIADAENGHRSATVCHLGNIAMRLGRSLRWDPVRERFLDDDAACRLLDKPRRGAWSL